MEFKVIIEQALDVKELYRRFETKKYGRNWSAEELALGFVGDVGDLAKLVQAQEGVREISESRIKLGHELADCLWSVIALADSYDIDLESEFQLMIKELKEFLEIELTDSVRS